MSPLLKANTHLFEDTSIYSTKYYIGIPQCYLFLCICIQLHAFGDFLRAKWRNWIAERQQRGLPGFSFPRASTPCDMLFTTSGPWIASRSEIQKLKRIQRYQGFKSQEHTSFLFLLKFWKPRIVWETLPLFYIQNRNVSPYWGNPQSFENKASWGLQLSLGVCMHVHVFMCVCDFIGAYKPVANIRIKYLTAFPLSVCKEESPFVSLEKSRARERKHTKDHTVISTDLLHEFQIQNQASPAFPSWRGWCPRGNGGWPWRGKHLCRWRYGDGFHSSVASLLAARVLRAGHHRTGGQSQQGSNPFPRQRPVSNLPCLWSPHLDIISFFGRRSSSLLEDSKQRERERGRALWSQRKTCSHQFPSSVLWKDWTQLVRFACKCLHPWSHLSSQALPFKTQVLRLEHRLSCLQGKHFAECVTASICPFRKH